MVWWIGDWQIGLAECLKCDGIIGVCSSFWTVLSAVISCISEDFPRAKKSPRGHIV